MSKVLLAVLLMFGLTNCTTVCSVAKSGAAALAPVIASPAILNCSNTPAIQAWLDGQMQKLGVCQGTKIAKVASISVSDVGSFVCAPLVAILADVTLKQVPPEWGCSGGALTDSGRAALLALCLEKL